MSLNLDARQRAMLQEMGIAVWAPISAPAAAPVAAPVEVPAAAQHAESANAPAPAQPAHLPAQNTAPQHASTAANHAPARASVQAAPPAPALAAARTAPQLPALVLHAPQPLFPSANPEHTPTELGQGWLIITDSLAPGQPLEGEAGHLLHNMLRAMRLDQHPRVFLATLAPPAAGTQTTGAAPDLSQSIAEAVVSVQPAMVLLLGHLAARAALARTEPLARMRAATSDVAGCPAVVSYAPALMLRSPPDKLPAIKADTWADLCRALAIVRQASPPAAP